MRTIVLALMLGTVACGADEKTALPADGGGAGDKSAAPTAPQTPE